MVLVIPNELKIGPQIYIFTLQCTKFLRTFPENTKRQSGMVLVNELKLCYNALNFSFLHENVS